jgi:hypothetical protein
MTATIDLGGVRLSEGRPTWVHAFPVGTYHHPVHGELHFTRVRLERIADGVNGGVRGITPALDFDHREDRAKGGKAAGWIEAAEVRPDGLWIAVAFTAEALAEVRAGAWKYISPEFVTEWTHPRTGVHHRDVLLGAALTNRPFLRDLQPVAACEPAIWSDPRIRSAGITLADVLAWSTGTAPSAPATEAADVDPQARFVRLAERYGSYRVAAREHPEAWAAAREVADLNGWADDDPEEVARLVQQAVVDYGLTASEATYMSWTSGRTSTVDSGGVNR